MLSVVKTTINKVYLILWYQYKIAANFINEKFCILIQILQMFVAQGSINNKSVLVQIMAWRRIGDKPLSESILAQFTDPYYVAMGRWVMLP